MAPLVSEMSPLQQLQYQQMQAMQQQCINNPMFSLYPYQMMSYAMYMEQMKNHPYVMSSMQPFPTLETMQGLQGVNGVPGTGMMNVMGSSYIPFSKLPFQRGSGVETKKDEKKIESSTSLVKETEQKPMQTSSGRIYIEQNQPIDFKKKSCHHVAIAYNIHFDRLKKKGLLENISKNDNYEKLDPTFPAKRIRQRKVSDGNGNDNTSV